jgi:hypothetical protein
LRFFNWLSYPSDNRPYFRNNSVTSPAALIHQYLDNFDTTLTAKVFEADSTPSVTFTVKVKAPAVVGLPEIIPLELRLSPGGKLPDEIDQV